MLKETQTLHAPETGRGCFFSFEPKVIRNLVPSLTETKNVIALHTDNALALVLGEEDGEESVEIYRLLEEEWSLQVKINLGERPIQEWLDQSTVFNDSGSVFIAGDPENYNKNGVVHLFCKISKDPVWVKTGSLEEPYPKAYPEFGYRVSTNPTGNIVIIGVNEVNEFIEEDECFVFSKRQGTWFSNGKIKNHDIVPNYKVVELAYPWI